MKKNLELNQNFFLSENVDHKQKLFQKRQLKSIVVTRTTVLQMKLMLKRWKNLINDTKPNLIKAFTDPSNGMIVDDIIIVNDLEVNKAYNKKLDQDVQQNYNEVSSKMIKRTMMTCFLKWLVITRLEIR